MKFKDKGHYYLNGKLMEDFTLAKCREEGGIVSVTTILENYTPPGLVFWKIDENIECAYDMMPSAFRVQATLPEFRKMVADEFYRTHNHLVIGDVFHKAMAMAISQAVSLDMFNEFWRAHADTKVWDIVEAAKMAYEWLLEHTEGGKAEVEVYDKDRFLAGTADYSGRLMDDSGSYLSESGEPAIRGLDWKTKFIKRHPGFSKKTGEILALPIKKDPKHPMQLGAYGRVLGWHGGWIINVSTNPDIPAIKPVYYDGAAIVQGYQAFGHLNRTFRIMNNFTEGL